MIVSKAYVKTIITKTKPTSSFRQCEVQHLNRCPLILHTHNDTASLTITKYWPQPIKCIVCVFMPLPNLPNGAFVHVLSSFKRQRALCTGHVRRTNSMSCLSFPGTVYVQESPSHAESTACVLLGSHVWSPYDWPMVISLSPFSAPV